MKLLICSDIHGDATVAEKILLEYKNHKCDKLVILGDILYHGPRNDLPKGYAPKRVISLLNEYAEDILAVRGNCDTEVDQMVLSFPILADYALIHVDGLTMYLTHGHKFNKDNPPPTAKNCILLHGHTHVPCAEKTADGFTVINPGSPSIPKDGSSPTYLIYECRKFKLFNLHGETEKELIL